jgi:hypothetical protein
VAYLFTCYIFVHPYEEDEHSKNAHSGNKYGNEHSANAHNVNNNVTFDMDIFIMDAFFSKLLRSLHTRTCKASKNEIHYEIDNSSINTSPTFVHFTVFKKSRFQGLPQILKPISHDKG